jgi:transcriptional regulator with XRE-family HTH domain
MRAGGHQPWNTPPPARDPVAQAVGAAIVARRARLGLRQIDLAEHCGFDRVYISYIEHGQRNLTVARLACIADALGCTASDLLREAGL